MSELTWIDPATGEPHRNDHICNQQCRELRAAARKDKAVSNYPEGVSDSHPYFNPQEGSVHVVCGNDEAKVVPASYVHSALTELHGHLDSLSTSGWAVSNTDARVAVGKVRELLEFVVDHEQDGGYECPFEGVVDVAISEEAEWTCPLCGATRTSDTTPDDRDDDDAYDRMRDERYDD